MNEVLLTALIAAAVGLVVAIVAVWVRRSRGLEPGETVALDDVTLYSERLQLVGRPDRIVKRGGAYIPEEWKSSRRVSHGHRLQLATYFILIEEQYGVRPAFGVIVLGDGTRVEVPNTEALREEVLSIAAAIRERRARLKESVPVNQPAHKCRKCGQRENCSQASE
jgi:CRISPR-associated exonuclease Cas4